MPITDTEAETGRLVIKRRLKESVTIDGRIKVTIERILDGSVRISITAPRSMTILRDELQGIPK